MPRFAATGIRPIYDDAGHALAEIIAPIVGKLRPLAENPPAGFSDDDKAALWHAYAAGEQQLGEERGDNARLAIAIGFYRKVLTVWTRERVPLDWAMTQNNLGTALARLGERESGTARLEEAIAAFREALTEWTRERVPLQWATTQNNLGNALVSLGERESGTARLDEAVAAFREALTERTRERVPLDWATTQNNLGNALASLGERESGTARLEEAVAAYREALTGVHPRARAARLGDDAEQSRHCAFEPGRARERHGAARRGRRRLSRGLEGVDPRARAARNGR